MRKVSLIVPVYNSEEYIGKCLDSILKQTYKNFEIIIINDGSKDNSWKIITDYKDKYADKIIAINQENKGVAITRNETIRKANGDYIMFIDNDDFIDEDYIQTFVDIAESKDFDIVLGGYRRITEKNVILKEQLLNDNEEFSKFIIMAPWAKLYKKQFLLDNEIQFLKCNIGEDVYFNLNAMLSSNKIKIINYIGYNWFYNTASVSNTIQKNINQLEVFKLLDSCIEMLSTRNLIEKNYDILKTYFTRYIIWILSFSTKKLSYSNISVEYDKLFKWLESHFSDYKKNKNISYSKPVVDEKKQRIMQKMFLTAHKFHFGKILVYIYSKI